MLIRNSSLLLRSVEHEHNDMVTLLRKNGGLEPGYANIRTSISPMRLFFFTELDRSCVFYNPARNRVRRNILCFLFVLCKECACTS